MPQNQLNNLTVAEIEHGITLALENAAQMIKEGDLLFENNMFARAYTLYQLATEEVGKSRLLFSLIITQIWYQFYTLQHSMMDSFSMA